MKYVGNHDRLLLGGLAVALVVVFAKPIQYLLDLAREVEAGLGLSLLPALIILTGYSCCTSNANGRRSRTWPAAAEAEAQQAQAARRRARTPGRVRRGAGPRARLWRPFVTSCCSSCPG